MSEIKAVLFDLDGTTLYTLGDLKNALNYALEKNDEKPRSIEDVRRFIGNGMGKLVERSLPHNVEKKLYEIVMEDFKEYYSAHKTDETVVYEGIIELLEKLKRDGLKIGTVSNKTNSAAVAMMSEYFGELMDTCVGELEGVPIKPAPNMVMLALSRLGITSEQTIYVGDSEVDVKTAENSGCIGIAATWGYRDKAELTAAGAKLFAENPKELYELITIIRKNR